MKREEAEKIAAGMNDIEYWEGLRASIARHTDPDEEETAQQVLADITAEETQYDGGEQVNDFRLDHDLAVLALAAIDKELARRIAETKAVLGIPAEDDAPTAEAEPAAAVAA